MVPDDCAIIVQHLDASRLWDEAVSASHSRLEEEFFTYLEKLVGAPMRLDSSLAQLIAFITTGRLIVKSP